MTRSRSGRPTVCIWRSRDGTKLAVAVLKPAALPLGAGLPTDTRAWIGVKATDVGASLEGIDGLVLSLTGGSFSYNSASGLHDSNGGLATDGTITNAVALIGRRRWGRRRWSGRRRSISTVSCSRWPARRRSTCSGSSTGKFTFTVDSVAVSATVGTGGAVDTLTGALLTTLSLEVVDDPVTIGPADGVHLEITRRDQACGRGAQARGAAARGWAADRHAGVDRCQGDGRRRLAWRGSMGSCSR